MPAHDRGNDPDATPAGARRRGSRPSWGRLLAGFVVILVAVPAIAWLVRPDSGPVASGPQPAPAHGWVAVDGDEFATAAGAVSADGAAVVGDRVVVVGTDARNAEDRRARPGVWLSDDGTGWRRLPADAIEVGVRLADSRVVMTDVAAVDVGAAPRLVAVGFADFEPGVQGLVWLSDDRGESWHRVPGDGSDLWADATVHAVTATHDGVVAVGGAGAAGSSQTVNAAVWTSRDGGQWTAAQVDGAAAGDALYSVAASGGRLAALGGSPGADQPPLWASAGGRSWERATVSGLDERAALGPSRIVAVDDGFLAVGAVLHPGERDLEGIVLRSPDGAAWQPAAAPVGTVAGDAVLHDLVADDVDLLAVGAGHGRAAVFTARDGDDWEAAVVDRDAPRAEGSVLTRVSATPHGLLALGTVDPGGEHERATVWLRPASGGG